MIDGHVMTDFMQYPQIPNFYIANLETQPFSGILMSQLLDMPIGLYGCVVWKSCIKPKVNVFE